MNLEVMNILPESGSCLSSLLFVHGANHGAWCWKEKFLAFFSSRGFQSIAVSLRGHGKSEGHQDLDSFSLDDYVEDVLSIMELLKNKPVLIGHSMGGAIVQKILHLHPDKVQAAVLLASVPPSGMLKDFLRLLFTRTKDFFALSLFNKGKTDKFPIGLFLPEELSDDEKEYINKLLQPESFTASKECLKRIVPRSIKVEVPILVLGSNNDKMISKGSVISTGNAYGVKPVILSGISHDIMLDPKWEIAAHKILDFLTVSAGVKSTANSY